MKGFSFFCMDIQNALFHLFKICYKVDFIKTDAYEDCFVKRTTYIGDTLYVLDSKGNIYSFAL